MAETTQTKVIDIRLPEIAESVVEGELIEWKVEEGGSVRKGDPLAVVMTDKVTIDLPSPYTGVLRQQLVPAGAIVKVHQVIAKLETEVGEVDPSLFKPAPEAQKVKNPFRASAQVNPPAQRPRAAPAARRLARELGVPLENVSGSGVGGRVRLEDLRRHLEPGLAPPPVPAAEPRPGEHRVPLRGMRRAIAEQMSRSAQTTARAMIAEEADMTQLKALRQRLKPAVEARGGKLSYLPFIFKAVATALSHYPELNSSLDEEAQEIIFWKQHDLGMAVDTDSGLVVPVVREVDRKSLLELAIESGDLADRARSGRLRPEETRGSTFTITNIGAIGGLFSVPVIHVPNAAILGMHRFQERPVVKEGEIQIRTMTYFSLALDHRLVDGAAATRFLMELIRYLENPEHLFLEAI